MATKKRRLNGDGSFKKRKNGTWEYRVAVPGQYDKDGKQIRISTYGKTQTEARQKAQSKLNQYATGTVHNKEDITVSQLARQICDERLNDGTTQEQSYDRNIGTIKQLDEIGNIPIQRITEAQLREFCNSQRKYADTTIKKIYQMLGRTFKEAVARGIIQTNPMIKIKKPRSAKPNKDVRALTIDEEKRLLAVLQSGEVKYSDVMLIALFTGMRTGEVLALQVCDVDLTAKVIHVTKTISRRASGAPFVNMRAKTDAGKRDILIGAELCAFMEKLTDGKRPDEYIFTDNGKLIVTATIYYHYTAALKKYNIIADISGKKVTLHSLRHTYATRCIESGMQAKVLQYRLGHENIETTYDIYGDVFALYENACLDRADEYMKSIGVQLGYADAVNTDK